MMLPHWKDVMVQLRHYKNKVVELFKNIKKKFEYEEDERDFLKELDELNNEVSVLIEYEKESGKTYDKKNHIKYVLDRLYSVREDMIKDSKSHKYSVDYANQIIIETKRYLEGN